ncbi:endolytic transglycosylase MltG, partial [bacterium]|nr:endolytic transglycosylase MltG [candidate division CSSED10-310 bacterium]
MKRLFIVCLLSIVIGAVIGVGSTIIYFYRDFRTPANPSGKPTIFEIRKGASLRLIADDLKRHNLIKHTATIIWSSKLLELTGDFKAGEYEISAAMTPEEIVYLLCSGKVILYKFTVPEGLTIKDIAEKWESNGFGSEDDFIQSVLAYHHHSLDRPPTGWEGYLFPETYYFPKGTTAQSMIEMMIDRFQKEFSDDWLIAGKTHGMNQHELVTLASLVEKETSIPSERPIVSSVFHNRLRLGMLLQCDPTVIYALGESYTGKLTFDDLEIDNAYNTYQYPGLPPGPIANPGAESIYAACFPADTSFLYFVVKSGGGHEFSTSLSAHNRAVQRYRRQTREMK